MIHISETQLRVIVGAVILMNESSDATMEEIKTLASRKAEEFNEANRQRELRSI